MSLKQGIIEKAGTEADPLTWDNFVKEIRADIDEYKENAKSGLTHTPWIYRGQSNSKWGLETSLERFMKDDLGQASGRISVKDYYVKLSAVIPAINSLTNHKFRDFVPTHLKHSTTGPILEYELLCYLRHHGFPTPLLDWTESYYVAAFFAFYDIKKGQNENVSVYAYKELNGKAHSGWTVEPKIERLGPYLEAHPRHYAQQSNYTVCRSKENGDDRVFFRNHEDAFTHNPDNQRLKKFYINAAERGKALEELYAMNINEHTLFGDEGSLLKTLAYKELVLKRR